MPRKWSLQFNIKKGDELEVEEEGNKITVSTEKSTELKSKEIDVTGLDRTTILYYIQSLYRMGYDEIKVIFNESATVHFRTNEKVKVITVIHNEVNRLIGFEIIQQKENYCIIKDLSTSSIKEFDNILRRIFLLLNDASSDLLKGAKEFNISLIETIEEKHDSITKFISYCSRLLSKYGYTDHKKTIVLYHILIILDKVIDVLKTAGRDLLRVKNKLSNKTIELLDLIDKSIHLCSEFFFKFDLSKAVEIYKSRNEMLNLLHQYAKKLPPHELVLVSKLEHIMELLADIEVSRIGIGN